MKQIEIKLVQICKKKGIIDLFTRGFTRTWIQFKSNEQHSLLRINSMSHVLNMIFINC